MGREDVVIKGAHASTVRPAGKPSALSTPGLLTRIRGRGAEPPAAVSADESDVELTGYARLRERVEAHVRDELRTIAETPSVDALRVILGRAVDDLNSVSPVIMPAAERQRMIETLAQDMIGLGPLDELLADPTVTEIMVNGPRRIYVERNNRMMRVPLVFESERHVMQVIDRIVARIGRRIDELSPMVDARLDDGSRVHIIIPPLALTGPTITIRRFAPVALRADDLVAGGTMTQAMKEFLRACVLARLSVAVSGGGSSGKTTTLNVLSGFIPEDERIVTIEDAAELQLDQVHVVPLETRPANIEGRGQISIRDLVINALRMRPDRIVVGECRGGEALDMLQAMNTGHDGSLTTLHANSPRDALARLETMVLMAGTVLPSRAIREQIGSAIDIIVHQSRLRDGSRRITSITEVVDCVGGEIRTQEIFRFAQSGVDENAVVQGRFVATGVEPACLEHLMIYGQGVDTAMFDLELAGTTAPTPKELTAAPVVASSRRRASKPAARKTPSNARR